jgi:protein Tex
MSYAETIAASLKLRPKQVAAAIDLLDGSHNIPFIAPCRKEQTQGLDEECQKRPNMPLC